MSAVVSQITGVSIVCSTVCSGADQINHQSSASLAFVRGIHRSPVNSQHKGEVTRKMFPCDDFIMSRYDIGSVRDYTKKQGGTYYRNKKNVFPKYIIIMYYNNSNIFWWLVITVNCQWLVITSADWKGIPISYGVPLNIWRFKPHFVDEITYLKWATDFTTSRGI